MDLLLVTCFMELSRKWPEVGALFFFLRTSGEEAVSLSFQAFRLSSQVLRFLNRLIWLSCNLAVRENWVMVKYTKIGDFAESLRPRDGSRGKFLSSVTLRH